MLNKGAFKLKRIEKVYKKVSEVWEQRSKNDVLTEEGSTAQEIANDLELGRANVSLELNRLVREQKLIKVKSYPVRYIPTIIVEKLLDVKVFQETEVKSINDLMDNDIKETTNVAEKMFKKTHLI